MMLYYVYFQQLVNRSSTGNNVKFPYTALRWLGAWSTQAKRRDWQWGDWACSDRQRGG